MGWGLRAILLVTSVFRGFLFCALFRTEFGIISMGRCLFFGGPLSERGCFPLSRFLFREGSFCRVFLRGFMCVFWLLSYFLIFFHSWQDFLHDAIC